MRISPGGYCLPMSSGYNEQDIVSRFAGNGLAGFVQKPYTTEDLLAKVRAVLEKR
ncbi:MAG TPA: hypothetical protein VF524_08465 [Polyangia bacterium]